MSEETLPELKCGGCKNCDPKFIRACAPRAESESAWDETTEPDIHPAFLAGFDDDYVVDISASEVGGEGG